ncbi:Hypothetical_protein [Hexamita inflata]|uniref:Hypothetical_protein n=1 Tax=Hexamita inflata TaxID=28002 RepID=A0AA86UVK3_9EUKA|nr:Hypothetical protein HINF_LOCUS54016 [Hexamita inflata]
MIDLQLLVSQFIELLNMVYNQNFIMLEHAVKYFKQLSYEQKRHFAAQWTELDKLIGLGQKHIVQRQEKKTFSYTYIICSQIIKNVTEYAQQCYNENIQHLTFQNQQQFCNYIIFQTIQYFDLNNNSLYNLKQIKLALREYIMNQIYEILQQEQSGTSHTDSQLDDDYGYYDDGWR